MFKRILFVCGICICVFNIHFFIIGKLFTVVALTVVLGFFAISYWIAKRKGVHIGTALFLWSFTLVSCYFMWRNEGLFDEAILAFPGFLVFSVMISSYKQSLWLLAAMITNILAIGISNQVGWVVHPSNESDLDSAIVISVILFMTSSSVYLATLSVQQLLNKLAIENDKVNRSKQEILRLQNHDPLTSLPNRITAEQIFNERLKIGRREGFETSLMFIDVDNFKTINDTYGHAAGDKLLVTISQRLLETVRDTDSVCRFGGDEFVIVAISERDQQGDQFSALAEKILDSLREPIQLENNQVFPTVSIGISVAPSDSSDFSELYSKADLAMYATKKAGRNSYKYYNKSMDVDSARYLSVVQGLRNALEQEEFVLKYQGIQAIADDNIVSAEALLRWQSDELGEVLPQEFIPIAEQSGSIVDIGTWVLNKAISDCKQWHEQGMHDVMVSINVSSLQFKRGSFHNEVEQALSTHKLDGEYLVLELTESLLFEMNSLFTESLQRILSLGVKIAIDDFGTGYSNLGYLQQTSVAMLKIDRRFTSKILHSKKDSAIVEAILSMSKTLGMKVVAEGIENHQIKSKLIEMECEFGQGVLWNQALSHDEFLEQLVANKAH